MLNYREAGHVWVDAAKLILDPPKGVPLSWWPKFTNLTGGLRPHELTLLCAPTGAGKTQFMANMSAQFLIQRVPHFVAPVETGDTDYMARVVSSLDGYDFNRGDAPNLDRFARASEKLEALIGNAPMLVSTHDNRVEIGEMVTLLKYMSQEYGARVALLDNLNFFLKPTSAANQLVEMDSAIHEFVMLAKKIPIHTILVVHPKKTDGGRVVSEFDIKGSSTAVQEAANVILFNRPKPEDVANGTYDNTDREMIFRKVRRRGTSVGQSVWFIFRDGRLEEMKQ
jgi:twinkle protein